MPWLRGNIWEIQFTVTTLMGKMMTMIVCGIVEALIFASIAVRYHSKTVDLGMSVLVICTTDTTICVMSIWCSWGQAEICNTWYRCHGLAVTVDLLAVSAWHNSHWIRMVLLRIWTNGNKESEQLYLQSWSVICWLNGKFTCLVTILCCQINTLHIVEICQGISVFSIKSKWLRHSACLLEEMWVYYACVLWRRQRQLPTTLILSYVLLTLFSPPPLMQDRELHFKYSASKWKYAH